MKSREKNSMQEMIAEYMEKGFLTNIIAMFKSDPSLYELTGNLLRDDRFRVRIGTTALIEELQEIRPKEVTSAFPSLLPLLKDERATVRGDAAYLIGLIGNRQERQALQPLLGDPNPQVAEIIRDALADETDRDSS
jgi:HEAT repeat protein